MATNKAQVDRNVLALKRAMGIKGDIKPGDLTMKARAILTPKEAGIAPANTKKGLGIRGLI